MSAKHQHGKWTGLARKVVCGAAAAGMMAALVPASAFATDITSTWYDLPSGSLPRFEHEATDNGASYTYRYVTIGGSSTGRVAPMAETWYETLGLNYTDAYCGTATIYGRAKATSFDADRGSSYDSTYTQGSQGSLQTKNSTLAIMANSENPDEYIRNYCLWANGTEVPVDSRALDHGNGSVGSYSVSVSGQEYSDFPREVYMECDIIGATQGRLGSSKADYQQWIALENQRTDRPKSKTEPYDPTYLELSVNGGGGAAMVKTLHTVADAVDTVVAASKDSNGNHALQTRYGGNADNGTGSAIDEYEDLVQATQYYTLSKIADKTVKKATTAVLVGYDPDTGNYACRKFGTDKDPDGNQYGGRVANYLADISTSITEKGLKEAQNPYSKEESSYIAWYTPAQIVQNCDAAFVCDAYSANSISTYLATASDGKPHTVYTPKDATHDEEDNTDGLIAARNTASKNGKDVANFCFSYPCNMFGNFYAQGVENGMLAPITCAFTYPDLFDLTDMLGYWAKNVWHIKDSAVQSIVTSTAESMDLSGGQKIGSVSSNYQDIVQNIFTAGNQYYLKNTSAVDAINSGNLKTYSVDDLKARTSSGIAEGTTETAGSKTSKASYKATGASTVTYTASQSTSSKKVTVPATVTINEKTYKVTAIAKNAFKGSTATSIVIGKNVKSVKTKAFNNCKKLTKVTLGAGVTKLSKQAFYKTPKLKTLTVKSKKLAKKSTVKNAFKGSKLSSKLTVKRAGGVKKKQVKKSFTQKNLQTPTKVVIK